MKILLNGESRELEGPTTVSALLQQLGIDSRVVAVEVDRIVVKRAQYADTIVSEGSEVEIVAFVGGGSQNRRARSWVGSARGVALLFALVTSPLVAQERPSQPAPTASEEASMVYAGWAYLSAGNAARAADQANAVLAKWPRSVAALVLLVEADIIRAGAMAGLDSYERWLGDRKIEDAYVIRRIATSHLRDALRDPLVRMEALKALAADGDTDALAQLATASVAGRFAETAALAAMGDLRAVRSLIAQLKASPPNRGTLIDALSKTGSREAIPPLIALLDDPNQDIRAAAADALGKLNAIEAADRLRRMLADPKVTYSPLKWKAAAALVRLRDAAGLTYLRNIMLSQQADAHAELKIAAAVDMAPFGSEQEWIGQIRPLVGHTDPQIRLKAATLLAPYDNEGARIALWNLLQDRNPAIREAASQVLATRVAGDFATLRHLLRSADAPTRTQAAARILELTR